MIKSQELAKWNFFIDIVMTAFTVATTKLKIAYWGAVWWETIKHGFVREVRLVTITSTLTSEYPRCEVVSKGETVRLLKFYMSWVQNDANQFGFYLVPAPKTEGMLPVVWEDFGKAKPMILSFSLYLLKSYAFRINDDRLYDYKTGPKTRF